MKPSAVGLGVLKITTVPNYYEVYRIPLKKDLSPKGFDRVGASFGFRFIVEEDALFFMHSLKQILEKLGIKIVELKWHGSYWDNF